jgi:hypothetical protein
MGIGRIRRFLAVCSCNRGFLPDIECLVLSTSDENDNHYGKGFTMSWYECAIELAKRHRLDKYEVMQAATAFIKSSGELFGHGEFSVKGVRFSVRWCEMVCPSIKGAE